jgi:hypothetical protein
MGFLDMFDNPDIMSSLMGVGPLTGIGSPPPPGCVIPRHEHLENFLHVVLRRHLRR